VCPTRQLQTEGLQEPLTPKGDPSLSPRTDAALGMGQRWEPPAPYLEVRLVLDELLGASVQEANVGVTLLHRLPAQLHDQPQHPVGSRVLGPKVYGQSGDFLVSQRVLVCAGGERGESGREEHPSPEVPRPFPAARTRRADAGQTSKPSSGLGRTSGTLRPHRQLPSRRGARPLGQVQGPPATSQEAQPALAALPGARGARQLRERRGRRRGRDRARADLQIQQGEAMAEKLRAWQGPDAEAPCSSLGGTDGGTAPRDSARAPAPPRPGHPRDAQESEAAPSTRWILAGPPWPHLSPDPNLTPTKLPLGPEHPQASNEPQFGSGAHSAPSRAANSPPRALGPLQGPPRAPETLPEPFPRPQGAPRAATPTPGPPRAPETLPEPCRGLGMPPATPKGLRVPQGPPKGPRAPPRPPPLP